MNIRTKQYIVCALWAAVVLLVVLAFPVTTFAQGAATDTFGVGEVNDTLKLSGDTDIRVIVAKIIRAAFGLLGIIALGLMLYGGFIYMTSGGQEDKVEQGRKILINATIGLAIILSSLAIVQFVLSKLQQATGSGIADDNGGGCENLAGCNGGPGLGGDCVDRNNLFVVRSLTPQTTVADGTGMSDVTVRAVFSRRLADDTQPQDVFESIKENNQAVQPIRVQLITPRVVEAVFARNTANCAQGNGEASCLSLGTYNIEVNAELLDNAGRQLETETECGDFPRESVFTVNQDARDQTAPTLSPILINGVNPQNQGEDGMLLPKGAVYPIQSRVTDRLNAQGGVGYVHLRVEKARLGGDAIADVFEYDNGPLISSGSHGPYDFVYNLNLDGNFSTPRKYTVAVSTSDIDGNSAVTSTSFILVGENCLNGIQDPGEDDVDIGGECQGMGPCEFNWQCASGLCVEGQCVATPLIEGLYPLDDNTQWSGAAGNFVTVKGKFFGQQQGTVSFGLDANRDGDVTDQGDQWVDAVFPQCGIDTWSNSVIVATVPGDALPLASLSAIRVRRAQQQQDDDVFEDTTINTRGPRPGPRNGFFEKTDENRPALCTLKTPDGVSVRSAVPAQTVVAHGKSFGDGVGSSLRFAGFQAEVNPWGDQQIVATVPRLAPGLVPVQVTVGQKNSNALPLRILSDDDANRHPVIDVIDPPSTTLGSFVTLTGKNFGDVLGRVYAAVNQDAVLTCSGANADPSCVQMVVDLPAQCGDTWSDTQVIIEVPGDQGMAEGVYAVALFGVFGNSDGLDTLEIVNGPERPGLCRIDPFHGPAPLPQGATISVFGINLSDNPELFFWKRGSVTTTLNTWLTSLGHAGIISAFNDTSITTKIPVDGNTGQSMISGPIKALTGAQVTNGINYTVGECAEEMEEYEKRGEQHPLLQQGYHCCTEGLGANQWIENRFACPGEVRQAGYVWRFTTGIIPKIPDVVREIQCGGADIPSPTPWERREPDGLNVCVNADIAARFTLDMDPATLNAQHVRLYACGQGEEIDCGSYEANKNVTANFGVAGLGTDGVRLTANAGQQLQSNTWYRVTLSRDIRARHRERILDEEVFTSSTLFIHRELQDLPDTVAYYFDFKTGDSLCQLESLGITPHTFSVGYLGMVQDPRFQFDALAENGAPAQNPLYYYLWGRADQECILMNVDRQDWEWGTTNLAAEDQAHAEKSPGAGLVNTRATAEAQEDRGIVPAYITVVSTTNDFFRATSTLDITLGDPHVVAWWPNCEFACTNATIGVRFNRPMMQASYPGGIVIQKCNNELCSANQLGPGIVPLEERRDKFSYEVRWPANFAVTTGTWYLVTVRDTIRSIARIENGVELEGEPLELFQWRFRTKADDGECRIDHVVVSPDPFSAQVIGQKTRYGATPISSPDACSPNGQRLDAWQYGWDWSTRDRLVATTSQFISQGRLNPFCGLECLPVGSTMSRGQSAYLCGNRAVDPGEDCDIGIDGEVLNQSCTLQCLRPGSNPPLCGDGNIDPIQGEECDTADANTRPFCTARCTWQGSPATPPQGELGVTWCGSPEVTSGEDCEVSLSLGEAPQPNKSAVGCSPECLHIGTALSQGWCDTRAPAGVPAVAAACQTALSSCGNSMVEKGEECEIVLGQLRVALPLPAGGTRDIAVQNPEQYCTGQCLLQSICSVQQVPHANVGGLRCDRAAEGCANDCTLEGSSGLYSLPSLCSDGQRGIGEYAACEVAVGAGPAPLGQNPLQVVTAIGKGVVNAETKAQETDIIARAVRDSRGALAVEGAGDYALQCGYEEFGQERRLQSNILASFDWNMEAPGIQPGTWSLSFADADHVTFKKSNQQAFNGAQSLMVTSTPDNPSQGVQISVPPLEPGAYEYSFHYFVTEGGVLITGFKVGDETVVARAIEIPDQVLNTWQIFQLQIQIDAAQENNSITIGMNDIEQLFIDDIEIHRVNPDETASTNNCPGDAGHPNNQDNFFGVGTNSCCAPHPARVSEYPVDGAGLGGTPGVCMNTAIKVEFHEEIDPNTLAGNVSIAKGYDDPNFDCSSLGQEDVTRRIGFLLADASQQGERSGGFWHRMWAGVRNFFANLFARVVFADNGGAPATWCLGGVTGKPEVFTVTSPDGAHVTSTITIALDSAFDSLTTYAVLLRGGSTGIKNIGGVSIRGKNAGPDGVFAAEDIYMFRTSDKICKINAVRVNPPQRVFTAPGESDSFVATAYTIDNQEIQSIPNVYSWNWQWVPANHPLFQVATPAIWRTAISAGDLEGSLAVTAQARISADVDVGPSTHRNRVFSGVTKLTALFCERPWPGQGSYPYLDTTYNVSFGYCADKGQSGVTSDDLPYINGSLTKGEQVMYADIDLNGRFNEEDANCYIDVFNNPTGVEACVKAPLRQIDLDCNGDVSLGDLFGVINRNLTGEFGDEVDANDNNIPDCLPEDRDIDIGAAPVIANTLKRTLFFNDQNDDVLGFQIFRNDERKAAHQWVMQQFPFYDTNNLTDISIGGYDAVTDGSNYYVNGLNQIEDRAHHRVVYNNIYHFSINPDAQDSTRVVLEKIIESVLFNTNLTDFGYCLQTNIDAAIQVEQRNLPQDSNDIGAITTSTCQTDFDCRNPDGTALEGTNGVCSNAKTRFLRDWQRLNTIKGTQFLLEQYKATHGAYPSLESGSYIPQYSNSRWPLSWGRVGSEVGAFPLDPINKWSQCGRCSTPNVDGTFSACFSNDQCPGDGNVCELQDTQTCWDPAQSQFICPLEMSVYEYEVENGQYNLHVPLEYFTEGELVVRTTVSSTYFTTERWCQPRAIHSPVAARCGDGVVSQGEGCDPAFSVQWTDVGMNIVQIGQCEITQAECINGFVDCGQKLQILPGTMGILPSQAPNPGTGLCRKSGGFKFIMNLDHSHLPEYVELFRCQQAVDCVNPDTYRDAQNIRVLDEAGWENRTKEDFINDFLPANQFQLECVNVAQVLVDQVCNVPEGNLLGQCRAQERAPRVCNTSCEWEYGICRADFSCGDGIVQAGETCDDGAQLNGTYGHCAGPNSRDANNELIGACQGQHISYCGNNRLDFVNRGGGAGFDPGDTPHEFCDEVNGVCEYIIEDVGRILPNVFILLDRSGSMKDPAGEGLGRRWDEALAGMDDIANRFANDINMGIGVFSALSVGENQCPPNDAQAFEQLLATGQHSSNDIRASYRGATPNGGTPTVQALQAIYNDRLFQVANDPLSQFRPKYIILITDGDPSCGGANNSEGVIRELNRLRDDFHVETYVVGFGGYNNERLEEWADAAGTERAYFASSREELFTTITQLFGCERYSHAEGNSCAADCQSFGGYCGDGVVQRDTAEQCDDGNEVDTDTCSNTCRNRAAAAAPEGPQPQCGNGTVDSGEVCDTGSDPVTGNGVTCIPEYNKSCAYCSADCQERLTVDPVASCGNGRIDSTGGAGFEACDVGRDGRIIRPPTPQEFVDAVAEGRQIVFLQNSFTYYTPFNAACFDKGTYECSNECRSLDNKCISCGTVVNGGAVPNVAIINPLTGSETNESWSRDLLAWLIRPSDLNLYGTIDYEGAAYTTTTAFNVPLDKRLETNNQCDGVYALEFNLPMRGGEDEPFSQSREDGLSFFPFPVNGQTRGLVQQLVLSPAVPQDAFRIVARWNKQGAEDVEFAPAIYNSLFYGLNGQPSIANASRAQTEHMRTGDTYICSEMQDEGRFHNEPGYWWPNEDECLPMNEVYMHGFGDLPNISARGMTIDTNLYKGVENGDLQNPGANIHHYAVFVEAIAAAVPTPISRFNDSDVTLEFYEFHADQSPRYSLFVPREFKLNFAQASANAGLAKYWHVFNLIYDQNTRRYHMELLHDANGQELPNGRVVTGYVDVLCGVPTHPCPRGESLRPFGIE